MDQEIEIKVLSGVDAIRQRPGMYIGSVENASVIFREIVDNAFDESYENPKCNQIFIDQNWNGYHLVMDNGRGIPIKMSPDKEGQTMADVAVSSLHSGSKFNATDDSRIGMNGVGSVATNALSESFILMSRITEDNFDKSTQDVYNLWNSSGPRSKKDLYYIVAFEKGIKVFEGADRLGKLEEMIFSGSCPKGYASIPRGYSTVILFKPDSEIFESTISELPLRNIHYFLLIQQKFYKKKVEIIANGESISGTYKPYQFELLKTIIPADTSKNKSVSVYVTFEADPDLGSRVTEGSVGGLITDAGQHINFIESCYEQALRSEYKIMHRCIHNGLRLCVVLLASEVVFDSQTKVRLKQISKVKVTDFDSITKEFIKIFRANPEYWQKHVEKLNILAESMKSLTEVELAKKLINPADSTGTYKIKNDLVEGFSDATCGRDQRWNAELFIVEGNSPAGSLKNGRKNTLYHAVLPLRGKVLNTSEKTTKEMMENKEMRTLYSMIGLGLDCGNVLSDATSLEEAYEILMKKSRYGKICIATDSDSDGSQISNGILYTLCRYSRFLVDFGMVYKAESPSYSQGGKYFYPSDPLQPGTTFPVGLDPHKHFRRYKGLGSLNQDEVYDAFFNPITRRLIQVTPEGIEYQMSLVEDINERKKLLVSHGILTNPYGLKD